MRIGALVGSPALSSLPGGPRGIAAAARELLAIGFESFEIEFWEDLGGTDLSRLADSFAPLLEAGAVVSSLGVYGNTLDPASATMASLRSLVDAADDFGAPIVSCLAGRLPGRSVPKSIEAYKAAFGGLSEKAAGLGLTIALESRRLGDTWKTGKWNIAINPDAWGLLFESLPGAPIGLEWEPAQQLLALANPRPSWPNGRAKWFTSTARTRGSTAAPSR